MKCSLRAVTGSLYDLSPGLLGDTKFLTRVWHVRPDFLINTCMFLFLRLVELVFFFMTSAAMLLKREPDTYCLRNHHTLPSIFHKAHQNMVGGIYRGRTMCGPKRMWIVYTAYTRVCPGSIVVICKLFVLLVMHSDNKKSTIELSQAAVLD